MSEAKKTAGSVSIWSVLRILAWSIIGLAAATLVTVRGLGLLENQPKFLDDPAIRNFVAWGCWFFILVTAWGWFCFLSRFSLRARVAVMAAPFVVLAIGLTAGLMVGSKRRIEFSGSMFPRLAPQE